jgi:hypothetical protein
MIDPDEPVMVNGVEVTGRTLAEARQELSHRGVHNPRWAELTAAEQETAALSAGGWLRAVAELAPAPDAPPAAAGEMVPGTVIVYEQRAWAASGLRDQWRWHGTGVSLPMTDAQMQPHLDAGRARVCWTPTNEDRPA